MIQIMIVACIKPVCIKKGGRCTFPKKKIFTSHEISPKSPSHNRHVLGISPRSQRKPHDIKYQAALWSGLVADDMRAT